MMWLRRILSRTVRTVRHHVAYFDSGGGFAVRRLPNLRASDGVAMTEFALIVPVFLLIVAGMLGFGRALFYWIDANHLANETARWAVVDRNPFAHDAPAVRSELRRHRRVHRCVCLHLVPRWHTGHRTSPQGHDQEAVHVRADRQRRNDQHRRLGNPSYRARDDIAYIQDEREPRDVLMKRLSDNRGGVLVLGAVMIPLFLLLTALIVDVGDWYIAQAPAAKPRGRGGARRGRPVPDELAGMHHEHDPAGHRPRGCPTVRRRSCGDRTRSTQRSPTSRTSTSSSTPRATPPAPTTPTAGGPCFDHPSNTNPESESNITPSGGYWTDVKVKENNIGTIFGGFGLNLLRTTARARVELKEAASGDQFIPIAVPEQTIVKAQVRFINECDGSQIGNSVALKPLKTTYQTQGGMQLWGPDLLGNQASVDPGQIALTTPQDSAIPIPAPAYRIAALQQPATRSTTSRSASRSGSRGGRTSTSTRRLRRAAPHSRPSTSADCFKRISEIRVYRPDNGFFGDRPQIRNVTFSPSGTSPCALDPYYTRLALPATNCTFDASVFMDWGSRPLAPDGEFEATIQVGSGTPRNLAGSAPQGPWVASGIPISSLGPVDVKVNWKYTLKNKASWAPGSMTGNCKSVRQVRIDGRAPRESRRRPDRQHRSAERPRSGREAHDGSDYDQPRTALGRRRTTRSARTSRSGSRTLTSPATSRSSASAPGSRTSRSSAIRTGASPALKTHRRRSTSAASHPTRATTRPRRPSGGLPARDAPTGVRGSLCRELPRT